ncbi:MAG TPA: glycosyltransferase family 4 protein, partial [Kofleriaceae bacterium]|nr:glycosyltransferase family 4 protein [Kofleriaceae bacterium]
MRVCMVIPYDLGEEGGVKRHGVRLAAALRALGDEVDVVGPSSVPIHDPNVHAFRGVVNVASNGSENHIGIFTSPLAIRRLLRARRYDVVHVHEPLIPSLNYWAVWSAGTAARIATFHAYSEHESLRLRAVRRVWSAFAFRSYDRGIAVSPAAAEPVRAEFAKPLAIIPNGIDTSIYMATALPHRGTLRLLFVGHWRDPRKGLPVLLDACDRLRGIDWTLDVVGDGGAHPRREHRNVHYHGAIASESQLASLYAMCDVFVAPALGMESFGIVLLEAMAAGRAIVCSDIAGYRHAAGDVARYVPPRDSAALAAAISELAASPSLR